MNLHRHRVAIRTTWVTEEGVTADPPRFVEAWWVSHDNGCIHPLLPFHTLGRRLRNSHEGAPR